MMRILGWLGALALLTSPAVPGSTISETYKSVRASVVVIETVQKEIDPSFPGLPVSVGGLGSGVLISSDGKVLTAAHVVQTADSITVRFLSGESMSAQVVASEPAADLALLQLERKPGISQVAPLGDSDRSDVGDQIFIVGAPFGVSHTLTVGHISARRVSDDVFEGLLPAEMFQTDASINTGNSGGPMFNMNGEVVGVVSYIITQSGGSEGLGFAITSNMARRLLIDRKSLWSGAQGKVLEGDVALLLNLPQPRGVLIERVAEGSPAARLGLLPGVIPVNIAGAEFLLGGDIVLEVQGISVADDAESGKIRELMNALQPGDELRMKVLRRGRIVELSKPFPAVR